MKKIILTVTLLFLTATSAQSYDTQKFCENNYLKDYGYAQVEYCVKKETKAARELSSLMKTNDKNPTFKGIVAHCGDNFLEEYGMAQVHYCVKKEIASYNKMNPKSAISSAKFKQIEKKVKEKSNKSNSIKQVNGVYTN